MIGDKNKGDRNKLTGSEMFSTCVFFLHFQFQKMEGSMDSGKESRSRDGRKGKMIETSTPMSIP